MTALLTLSDLSCERDDRTLFSALSLTAYAGEIWQVVGPNGAGKTTLLRILTGLFGFYQGRVDWSVGGPLNQALLYLGHTAAVRDELTPRENLHWQLALEGNAAAGDSVRLDQALAQVRLTGYEDLPVGSLSAGQKRRVALARLWLSSARIWILDEPFTAIDRDGVALLEQRIADHAAGGGLVMYTSHHKVSTQVKQIQLGNPGWGVEMAASADTGSL